MTFLYIVIILFLLYLSYTFLILPYLVNKKMLDLFKTLTNKYHYKQIKKALYHYTLENQEIKYLINVCIIPSNSTVTINSKDTWSLTWGGNPKNKGRAYHKQRYLTELTPFLQKDYANEKKVIKLIILYPHTENILRYLNESELDIVKAKDSPYGYKVTTYKNFLSDLEVFSGGQNEKNI